MYNLQVTMYKKLKKFLHPKVYILNSPKGFTLVELLIVIAIIGVLATIVTVSLGSSQQRARDAQRKSDLKQIANALEIYFNNNAGYPNDNSGAITGTSWGGAWSSYMRVVPADPTATPQYCYDRVTGNSYDLFARLENPNDPDKSASTFTCNGVATYNYRLQNPF